MLRGEADHRIANSLAIISSLVRLRASKARTSVDPKRFLLEIADRIETVASLHRVVAHTETDRVQIGSYLRQVCDKLTRALAPEQTSLSLTCSPEYFVPFKVALPLGLMTGELFSNSLKYAHPTGLPIAVSILCERTEDGLNFVYQDDGVGFPENFDFERSGNMGLRFIRALIDQLGATHDWASDPLGIRLELRVPIALSCVNENVVRGNFACQKTDRRTGGS
jgi:two-component sensor histidine kinase